MIIYRRILIEFQYKDKKDLHNLCHKRNNKKIKSLKKSILCLKQTHSLLLRRFKEIRVLINRKRMSRKNNQKSMTLNGIKHLSRHCMNPKPWKSEWSKKIKKWTPNRVFVSPNKSIIINFSKRKKHADLWGHRKSRHKRSFLSTRMKTFV